MTYTYKCSSCEHVWDASHSLANRDIPCGEECPHCHVKEQVRRIISTPASISYSGAYTIQQRAGWGWNDVLTKIKKGSGRSNTIETR